MFHLAAEPEANVVLPKTGFPANEGVAESLGLQVRHYKLRAKDNFQIDLDEVRKLVDRHTKLVLVNSRTIPRAQSWAKRRWECCTTSGVRREMENWRSPLASIQPFFTGRRCARRHVFRTPRCWAIFRKRSV